MSVWQSAADAAVRGLVVAAKTVNGPEIHDSLVVDASADSELLVVGGGLDPDNNSDRAYIEHKFASPGYSSDVEGQFTVWSEIGVLKGSADISVARNRCYAILRDWARAIANDVTLGGALDSAWVSEAAWRPQQVPDGAFAVLLVGVDCLEFTGP